MSSTPWSARSASYSIRRGSTCDCQGSDCQGSACRGHRFRGKVALVTGAASGLGRACAVGFGAEGAHLAICDLNEEGQEEICRQATVMGVEVITAGVNVRSHADVV